MITVEDMLWLYHNTKDWTRNQREFRMSAATKAALMLDPTWEPPYDYILARPVIVDDSVPDGIVDFEIPVPELPRGLV